MDFELTALQQQIRQEIRELCGRFPPESWRAADEAHRYPEEFVRALTDAGWLAALIPEQYGGAGLGVLEAGLILEEINRSGGSAAPCHPQMYTKGCLLPRGGEGQKRLYLPAIGSGGLRLQAFAVTEPDAGSDTTRITTTATDGATGTWCTAGRPSHRTFSTWT